MSEAKECSGIQFKHGSLKEILEELYKLQEWDFKQSVFNHLKDGLRTYCGETYLDAFYGSRGGSSYGGYIQAFTFDARNICLAIVKSVQWDGRSDNTHKDHPQCIQNYAEALKDCLPKTYAAFYYLYFMGSKTDFSGMHGGQWKDYACDGLTYDYGSGRGRVSKVDLYLWLTDVNGSGTGLVKRGFTHSDKHSFTNKKGSEVATAIANIIKHDSPEALQKVLCGFMFVCSWDDALTGHAICFLHTFCSKVNGNSEETLKEKWNGMESKKSYEDLKHICTDLSPNLQPFVDGSSTYLQAVCQESADLFEEIWDDSKFVVYCEWLKETLTDIIASLNEISLKPSPWSAETLERSHTAGPFKYGFVFTGSWDGSWDNHREVVQSQINELTASLNSLLKCLNGDSSAISDASIQEPTGNSGVTAAGAATGVLSLGGAGAGAAYGFNLFGLKDIMSGVFGAIRGLVVGF
ncbi:secreted antigen 1 [Babesia divergens]|uniref:Secreted antigen 1 n=1 Tax=Babesia divergens TaxID=32595 RepID=A0AAD9LJI1_BABDI|nr:secreted antigen 1 [Babesia divergens]